MKEAKNLFGKLAIEAPSAGFEDRIIANVFKASSQPKHSWYKSYAAVAAAVLMVFSFSMMNKTQNVEAEKEYAQLVDKAIDDEVYGDLIY